MSSVLTNTEMITFWLTGQQKLFNSVPQLKSGSHFLCVVKMIRVRREYDFCILGRIFILFSSFCPLTKEIRLKVFDPIISNSFPVRYYGISGTNLPDIP